MRIPRQRILDLLAGQGSNDELGQARQILPEQVDPERDADLLEGLGLNPRGLIEKFAGDMPTI
jgi:hypothetical protein